MSDPLEHGRNISFGLNVDDAGNTTHVIGVWCLVLGVNFTPLGVNLDIDSLTAPERL